VPRTIREQFWRNKKVFITGHTGFKGAWLSYLLSSFGASVYGYSLEPEHEDQFYVKIGVDSCIKKSFIRDIRDKTALEDAMKASSPDIVFHMAAQPLVRFGYQAPLYTFDVNVMGTANLLDLAVSMVKPLVVLAITTDKVYKNHEQIWPYRETDELGGTDPYSSSKACAELIINSYMESISRPNGSCVRIASARAGNVIGGGDWSLDRLIPDVMRSIQLGKTVSIRNPYATRPWQHVLDCLSGYIVLAERLYQSDEYTGAWNFGPLTEQEWNVERVVEHILNNFNPSPDIVVDTEMLAKKREHMSLSLDSTKSTKYLNWSPRLSVSEALDYTIREYRSLLQPDDFKNVIDDSIKNFFNKDI